MDLGRQRHAVAQHTVDAEADLHEGLVRLDVHVARFFPHGEAEHGVDEAHDLGGLGAFLQALLAVVPRCGTALRL